MHEKYILDKYDYRDDLDDKRFEDNELSDASGYDDFEFYFSPMEVLPNKRIRMNVPLPATRFPGKLEVVVLWSDKMINMYNTRLLRSLPEDFSVTAQDEPVSVYECLEAFLKEEPLGTENMWSVDISGLLFYLRSSSHYIFDIFEQIDVLIGIVLTAKNTSKQLKR